MFAASKTDGAVATTANYIEEVFSTYLYTGNGSTQTITNGIDLSTYGGLVWNKLRNNGTAYHYWVDTARGRSSGIGSNSTDAQYISSAGNDLTSFNTTGFTVGPVQNWNASNANGEPIVSWTFRKQAKFFDVVTYTGNGVAGTQISHNLGSTPGCIIVKKTDGGTNWAVYHRGLSGNEYLNLNNTDSVSAIGSGATVFGNGTSLVAPTSSVFTLGTSSQVNSSGGTYVAYLFAHDAGGFGAAGTDNVISCGSFSANANTTVNLGWEPQFILWKNAQGANNWGIADNMRGLNVSGTVALLNPNTTSAESSSASTISINSTGFTWIPSASGNTYIYIAIRRGPMKTPTSGTSVFSPQVQTPTGSAGYVMAGSSGFPVDWLPTKRKGDVIDWYQTSRLTNNYMSPNTTAAEGAYTYGFDLMQGVSAAWGASSTVSYAFRRAPGFFDVVCDTGTGVVKTVNHGLTVVPELMIRKKRNSASNSEWTVWHSLFAGTSKFLVFNANNAEDQQANLWNSTSPTSSVFTVGTGARMNSNNDTFVTYLFATVAGVSKVGSYTGTGTTKQIDCGFTAGARFVMIKRTNSTGDWYVWDTARGIVSGNDPYLLINSTAAEVTSTDYIDPLNAGFEISSTAPAAINANGGTFIFLAIA